MDPDRRSVAGRLDPERPSFRLPTRRALAAVLGSVAALLLALHFLGS